MLRLTLRPTKQQVVKLFHFSKDHDETKGIIQIPIIGNELRQISISGNRLQNLPYNYYLVIFIALIVITLQEVITKEQAVLAAVRVHYYNATPLSPKVE